MQCTQCTLELQKAPDTNIFTHSARQNRKSQIKERTLDRGRLVQRDVVMLAMFDTMFEMFKHVLNEMNNS